MTLSGQGDLFFSYWRIATKFDVDGVSLADRHYSRRKVGSPQFMPQVKRWFLSEKTRKPCLVGGDLTQGRGLKL